MSSLSRPAWSLSVVCLGYFMAALAMGPVAAILPTIGQELDVSVGVTGWIMNAYFVMLVGWVLVAGRLGDVYGHGRVFGLGVAAFTAGQLVCGLANALVPLLLGRALQGVASAMILGTSLAIISTVIPSDRRGIAIGLMTMTWSAAGLLGTWVATWSVQHLTWNWAFLIPLPLGVISAVLGLRLRLPRAALASRRVDWPGALLFFATLTAAMLALNHLHDGEETFQDGAPYHLAMHLVTLALLVAFLKVEQRAAAPLLSFRLLRDGRFSGGILANGVAHTSMLAIAFLMPFLVERGRGWSPAETGLLMMAQQAAGVGCSLAVGYLYDRCRSPLVGIGLMASIGLGLLAIGLGGESLTFVGLVVAGCLAGAASSGFSTANNTAIMGLAPDDQRGFASGLIETTRHFGHVVGVSISAGFIGAAMAGATAPTAAQYVAGVGQAAVAMGLVAFGGVLALAWPLLRPARRPLAPPVPRPIAGASD